MSSPGRSNVTESIQVARRPRRCEWKSRGLIIPIPPERPRGYCLRSRPSQRPVGAECIGIIASVLAVRGHNVGSGGGEIGILRDQSLLLYRPNSEIVSGGMFAFGTVRGCV